MRAELSFAALFTGCALLAGAPVFAQEDVAQPVAKPAPRIALPLAQSDPTALMESIQEHMKGGRPLAMWAALNPADRKQIETLVHGFAAKVDPGVYDEVSKLIARVGTAAGKNAQFFGGNAMLNKEGKDPEEMERHVKSFVGLLEAVTKSSLANHAGLAQVDLETFMATTGTELVTKLMTLAATPGSGVEMPNFGEAEVSEPEIEGDTAIVELTTEDSVDEISLKKVDGKWWIDIGQPLAEASGEIESMKKMTKEDAMQVRGIATMVAPMLRHFEDCESQEDFDEAVQKSFGMFMGMMMGGAAGPGGR